MKNTFSISQSISFGWASFKTHWKFWLIVFTIFMATSVSGNGGGSSYGKKTVSQSKEQFMTTLAAVTLTQSNVLGDTDMNPYASQNMNVNVNMQNNGSVSYDLFKEQEQNLRPYNNPHFDPEGLKAVATVLAILSPYLIVAALGIIFLGLLSIAVQYIFQMGLMHLGIEVARSQIYDYKTILSDVSVRKAFRLLLLEIVYVLIVFVGLMFFIIPGIYFAIRFMFAPYSLVDKNLGVLDSLSHSAKLTSGVKLKLIALFVVSFFIIVLGLLAFLVGIVPAAIVIQLATVFIYVTLEKQVAETSVPAINTQPELATDLK